jgi:hypothetical protein
VSDSSSAITKLQENDPSVLSSPTRFCGLFYGSFPRVCEGSATRHLANKTLQQRLTIILERFNWNRPIMYFSPIEG